MAGSFYFFAAQLTTGEEGRALIISSVMLLNIAGRLLILSACIGASLCFPEIQPEPLARAERNGANEDSAKSEQSDSKQLFPLSRSEYGYYSAVSDRAKSQNANERRPETVSKSASGASGTVNADPMDKPQSNKTKVFGEERVVTRREIEEDVKSGKNPVLKEGEKGTDEEKAKVEGKKWPFALQVAAHQKPLPGKYGFALIAAQRTDADEKRTATKPPAASSSTTTTTSTPESTTPGKYEFAKVHNTSTTASEGSSTTTTTTPLPEASTASTLSSENSTLAQEEVKHALVGDRFEEHNPTALSSGNATSEVSPDEVRKALVGDWRNERNGKYGYARAPKSISTGAKVGGPPGIAPPLPESTTVAAEPTSQEIPEEYKKALVGHRGKETIGKYGHALVSPVGEPK